MTWEKYGSKGQIPSFRRMVLETVFDFRKDVKYLYKIQQNTAERSLHAHRFIKQPVPI